MGVRKYVFDCVDGGVIVIGFPVAVTQFSCVFLNDWGVLGVNGFV